MRKIDPTSKNSEEANGSVIMATSQQQSRGKGRHQELEMGLDGLLVVARTPPPSLPLCIVDKN
jgi:hypothetical protein